MDYFIMYIYFLCVIHNSLITDCGFSELNLLALTLPVGFLILQLVTWSEAKVNKG